jgi:hypothetical protein
MAQYAFTFTSGDTVTPTKLNDARTVSEIVDADINSAAAIAGTKIAPDFGSQEIKTTGALTIGKTAVTSPVAGDGNVFSGTYTPTVTGVTNVASTSPLSFQYMRVGSVVTVSGAATLGFTTAGTYAELTISIPVASTFTNTNDCSGVMAINTVTSNRGYGAVFSSLSGTDARARIYPEHTAARGYSIHFTYRII